RPWRGVEGLSGLETAGQDPRREKDPRSSLRAGLRARKAKKPRQSLPPLGEVLAFLPEVEQRGAQAESPRRLAVFDQPVEGRPEVVVLHLEAVEPRGPFRLEGRALRRSDSSGALGYEILREDDAVRGVCAAGGPLL